MSGPTSTTSITITLVSGVGAGPFTLTIPTAMANIGSGAADQFIRDIFVRGGFWASDDKFYTIFQIASISAA